MATRKRTININGNNPVSVDPDISIRDALGEAGIENLPASIVSGGEVIAASDFDRPTPAHDMLLNLSHSLKGGSLRERLLDQEFDLIARFLGQFPGGPRSIELEDNYLLIRAFPLPDSYSPQDQIDLLILTVGYPDVPPAGVYLPSKTPNREQITKHLGGHVLSGLGDYLLHHIPDAYRKQVEEHAKALAEKGWAWMCFHYRDWKWKLNPNTLLAGDSLYKYVENVFAALSGGYRG